MFSLTSTQLRHNFGETKVGGAFFNIEFAPVCLLGTFGNEARLMVKDVRMVELITELESIIENRRRRRG